MNAILTYIDSLSAWVGKVVSFIMIPIVAIVCYEVAMRYLFHRPTIWGSEAMVYGCAFLYVLGAAWTLKENRHVKIDMLYERFSTRGQRALDAFTYLFFLLYMGMMLWVGWKFAAESLALLETSGTPWDPPVYPIKISFVVGVVMILLQGTAKFVRDLHFAISGKEL